MEPQVGDRWNLLHLSLHPQKCKDSSRSSYHFTRTFEALEATCTFSYSKAHLQPTFIHAHFSLILLTKLYFYPTFQSLWLTMSECKRINAISALFLYLFHFNIFWVCYDFWAGWKNCSAPAPTRTWEILTAWFVLATRLVENLTQVGHLKLLMFFCSHQHEINLWFWCYCFSSCCIRVISQFESQQCMIV